MSRDSFIGPLNITVCVDFWMLASSKCTVSGKKAIVYEGLITGQPCLVAAKYGTLKRVNTITWEQLHDSLQNAGKRHIITAVSCSYAFLTFSLLRFLWEQVAEAMSNSRTILCDCLALPCMAPAALGLMLAQHCPSARSAIGKGAPNSAGWAGSCCGLSREKWRCRAL